MKKIIKVSICVVTVAVALVCIIYPAVINSTSYYSEVLEENWNISLPKEAGCKKIYHKSDRGFEDGEYYTVLDCKEKEPINKMFKWLSDERKLDLYNTGSYITYSERTSELLDSIGVPSEEHPDYSQCVYRYVKGDRTNEMSEIILLWDEADGKLYITESIR